MVTLNPVHILFPIVAMVSAVVSAIGLKSKLHGLLIEKRQLETIGRTRDAKRLTDEELEEEIVLAREARKLKENTDQLKDDAATSLRVVSN